MFVLHNWEYFPWRVPLIDNLVNDGTSHSNFLLYFAFNGDVLSVNLRLKVLVFDPCLDLLIFRRRIVRLSFIAQWYTLITSDTIDWNDETKHLKLTSSSFKTFNKVKISSNKAISSVDCTAAFSASFSITLWWLNDSKWPEMTRNGP